MPWLSIAAQAASPLTGAEIVQVIISAANLGVLGIAFWLFVQGHLHSDSEIDRLAGELTRVTAEKVKAEEQRDEALRIARDQVVPLLTTFNATVSSLLPVLQDVVRRQEEERPRRTR